MGGHVCRSIHKVDGPTSARSAAVPPLPYARATSFGAAVVAASAWALCLAGKSLGSLIKKNIRNRNAPQPEGSPPKSPRASGKQRGRSSQAMAEEVAEVLARASTLLADNDKLKELCNKTHLVLTFAGEHSTGKSTIINAILGKEECKTGNTQGTTAEVKEFVSGAVWIVDTPGLDAPDFEKHKEQALSAVQRSDFTFLTLLANKPTSTAADTLLKEVKPDKLVVLVTYWDALKRQTSRNECKQQVRDFLSSRGHSNARVYYIDAAAAKQARCNNEACQDVGFNALQALLDEEFRNRSYLFRELLQSAEEEVKAGIRTEQDEILTIEKRVKDLEEKASKALEWSWGLGISSGVSGIWGIVGLAAAELAVLGPIGVAAAAGLGVSTAVSAVRRSGFKDRAWVSKRDLEAKQQHAKDLEELHQSLTSLRESLTGLEVSVAWYNTSQQNAINDSKKVSGITLVQGPPGTGKTTTVLGILSVLLSATATQAQAVSYSKGKSDKPKAAAEASDDSPSEDEEDIERRKQERIKLLQARAPWLRGNYVPFCDQNWQEVSRAGSIGQRMPYPKVGEESVKNMSEIRHTIAPQKVLVCGPSNASIDEVMRRIVK
ncbi:unnamed protein product, partial [Symbiodinium microadriaticum]